MLQTLEDRDLRLSKSKMSFINENDFMIDSFEKGLCPDELICWLLLVNLTISSFNSSHYFFNKFASLKLL